MSTRGSREKGALLEFRIHVSFVEGIEPVAACTSSSFCPLDASLAKWLHFVLERGLSLPLGSGQAWWLALAGRRWQKRWCIVSKLRLEPPCKILLVLALSLPSLWQGAHDSLWRIRDHGQSHIGSVDGGHPRLAASQPTPRAELLNWVP